MPRAGATSSLTLLVRDRLCFTGLQAKKLTADFLTNSVAVIYKRGGGVQGCIHARISRQQSINNKKAVRVQQKGRQCGKEDEIKKTQR